VVVKLLLHCGMCCLITMMVALGDAAIVTGLHIGAKLPLSVSFAVAVAANLVLVLLLLAMLVVARIMNAANNDRLAQMANRPEVRLWLGQARRAGLRGKGSSLFVYTPRELLMA
jgi:uncharacterized membrane protein